VKFRAEDFSNEADGSISSFVVKKKSSRRPPRAAAPVESARERVLRAALEVFADRGFEGAGTTEIARRAEVTQPLVHYHFETREVLWDAVVEHLFARLGAITEGAKEELVDLEPIARLKVMLRRYVRFSAANPEVARFFVREGYRATPRLEALVERYARPLNDAIRGLLADAQRRRRLKPLPLDALLCLIIVAGSHPFIAPALVEAEHGLDLRDAAAVERYADVIIESLFHGIAQPSPESSGRSSHDR
jgi:AcrR family transcriptional regulator